MSQGKIFQFKQKGLSHQHVFFFYLPYKKKQITILPKSTLYIFYLNIFNLNIK